MTPKALKLAAALLNVVQMESSLLLVQTFYGAVTATIRFFGYDGT
jgi:hypothetical protein